MTSCHVLLLIILKNQILVTLFSSFFVKKHIFEVCKFLVKNIDYEYFRVITRQNKQ